MAPPPQSAVAVLNKNIRRQADLVAFIDFTHTKGAGAAMTKFEMTKFEMKLAAQTIQYLFCRP